MNVLLLSDFSNVAINATHFSMDLLQEQQVNFFLLNIFDPDSEFSGQLAERKKKATLAILKERVQKLQERAGNRPHKITGHYSGENLVNSAREFVNKHSIHLIVMGAVGHDQRNLTILGKHTFEIMSKIKCNMLAVPEDFEYRKLERMLMPLDYSASFHQKNVRFLNQQKVFQGTRMSVWEIGDQTTTGSEERSLTKRSISEIDGIKADFSTLDKTALRNRDTWRDVQKKFQLIILMGKNIGICNALMSNRQGLFKSIPNRLPILVLHD